MDFLIGYLGVIVMGNAIAFALVMNHHVEKWTLGRQLPDLTGLFRDYVALSSLITLTTVEAWKLVLAGAQ